MTVSTASSPALARRGPQAGSSFGWCPDQRVDLRGEVGRRCVARQSPRPRTAGGAQVAVAPTERRSALGVGRPRSGAVERNSRKVYAKFFALWTGG